MGRKLVSTFIVLPLGLLLVIFAVVNRHSVTVSLDPFGGDSPALSATLPLFLLILVLLGIGVLAGGITTWLGQAKWRRSARQLHSELRAVQRERDALKAELVRRDTVALPAPGPV
jgi:uncharacterized integral membrane protein